MSLIAGIDYGAKLAGTTAICFADIEQSILTILQSSKNTDADEWLLKVINDHQIDKVFIDAPLSLPGVYFGSGMDYFYREADIQLKAMSPMFLGGLTARAMKLRSILERNNIECHEVYPAARVKRYSLLKRSYDKKSKELIRTFSIELSKHFPLAFSSANWHQVDAVISWWIGNDKLNCQSMSAGNMDEGIIYY